MRVGRLLFLSCVARVACDFATPRRQRVFQRVYTENLWESSESRSGPGSERRVAAKDVEFILSVVQRSGLKRRNVTIVDVPCGDMNWMPISRKKKGGKVNFIKKAAAMTQLLCLYTNV